MTSTHAAKISTFPLIFHMHTATSGANVCPQCIDSKSPSILFENLILKNIENYISPNFKWKKWTLEASMI
jgi:hypothetical protein